MTLGSRLRSGSNQSVFCRSETNDSIGQFSRNYGVQIQNKSPNDIEATFETNISLVYLWNIK